MRQIGSRGAWLVAAALLCVPACSAPPASEDEVMAVLDAFYGAIQSGDAAAAMRLVAPDAVFVESGRLETRAEYESNHLPNDIDFERQMGGDRVRRPVKVGISGDAAWVVAATDYDGDFQGGRLVFTSMQLMVLTRQNGEWLIRSIHWSAQ